MVGDVKKYTLHVYNRGNRKEHICFDYKDYLLLSNLINYNFSLNKFDLPCFCIMPNHFHILTKQRGFVPIGRVMQVIGAKYTKYFNKKYSFVGHLFQATYKSKKITNLDQFRMVSNYILKNPLDIGLPDRHPWLYYNDLLISYMSLEFFGENKNPIIY